MLGNKGIYWGYFPCRSLIMYWIKINKALKLKTKHSIYLELAVYEKCGFCNTSCSIVVGFELRSKVLPPELHQSRIWTSDNSIQETGASVLPSQMKQSHKSLCVQTMSFDFKLNWASTVQRQNTISLSPQKGATLLCSHTRSRWRQICVGGTPFSARLQNSFFRKTSSFFF